MVECRSAERGSPKSSVVRSSRSLERRENVTESPSPQRVPRDVDELDKSSPRVASGLGSSMALLPLPSGPSHMLSASRGALSPPLQAEPLVGAPLPWMAAFQNSSRAASGSPVGAQAPGSPGPTALTLSTSMSHSDSVSLHSECQGSVHLSPMKRDPTEHRVAAQINQALFDRFTPQAGPPGSVSQPAFSAFPTRGACSASGGRTPRSNASREPPTRRQASVRTLGGRPGQPTPCSPRPLSPNINALTPILSARRTAGVGEHSFSSLFHPLQADRGNATRSESSSPERFWRSADMNVGQCQEGHPFRGFHRRPHPTLSNVHQAQTWQWRQPQPRSPKAVEKPMLSRDRSSSLVRGGSAMRSETPEVSRPTPSLSHNHSRQSNVKVRNTMPSRLAQGTGALSCQRLGVQAQPGMSVQRKRSLPLFSQGQTPETTPEPQTLSWAHGRVQSKFLTEQQKTVTQQPKPSQAIVRDESSPETLPPGRESSVDDESDVSHPRAGSITTEDGEALQEASEAGELSPGLVMKIEGNPFRVTRPLGKGSFGVVWGADSPTHGRVAIKKILCWQHSGLMDAQFESTLLKTLADKDAASEEVLLRLPALIARETELLEDETWRVWIAMTRLPGEQLSKHLEGHTKVIPQPGDELCAIVEACNFAHELLVQLVPVFKRVAEVAVHRDATPRNILVDTSGTYGSRPFFSLIDFGLAVDAASWSGGLMSAKQSSIAGDGRYWPVSSWFAFEYGRDELSKCAGLYEEYRTRLDIHSLGLTAIQVLAELCPEISENMTDDLPQKLQQLLWVWVHYWRDATHYWIDIFQTFQEHGDFDALKLEYMRAGVHDTIRQDLLALRAAIREARRAAVRLGCASVGSLMDVLLLMISNGERGDVTWSAIQACLMNTSSETLNCDGEDAKGDGDSPSSTVPTTPGSTRLLSPSSSARSPSASPHRARRRVLCAN